MSSADTHTHDHSLSWRDTGTSIKGGAVKQKLVLYVQ
jgi:hypothetical protein